MRFIIVIILTVAIGIASYFAYIKYNNPNTTNVEKINEINIYTSSKTEFDIEIDTIQAVPKEEKDVSSLKYYGWIPDWDMADGVTSLRNNPHITSVSPFWFDLLEDGTLATNPYTNYSELVDYTSSNNVALVPTITSFDKDVLTKVLNSEINSRRFIDETINYIQQNNYQGIDLDFESFYVVDQKPFLDLMRELKAELNNIGKLLYFSSLAKWGNNISYAQSKSTLNYKALGDIVDVFIIQGYSYSATNSNSIGPVGPIDWQEDVIRYAINEGVPRNKIVLGVNTYAQDWSERPIQYDLLYYTAEGLPDNDFGSEAAVAYYHNGVDKLYSNYSVEEQFVENWGEMLGSYNFGGQKRYVVYPNKTSLDIRKKLAADYGLNGISYWRLGDEGTLEL